MFNYIIFAIAIFFISKKIYQFKTIKQYTPVDVINGVENSVLLDVRTEYERNKNKIKNSIHIPLNEILQRSKEIDKYRDKEIICYCQSGSRSLSAASKLKKLGFKSANMKGGIAEWNFYNQVN